MSFLYGNQEKPPEKVPLPPRKTKSTLKKYNNQPPSANSNINSNKKVNNKKQVNTYKVIE